MEIYKYSCVEVEAPSPWAAFAAATRISADALSEVSKEAVKAWLLECRSHHHACRLRTKLPPPKRLIRIYAGSHDTCGCLIETESTQKYRYVALSYCWGKSNTFTTTTPTLPERKAGISASQLPQTLKDAVWVTKWLGLHYLWVDSLCILQDSDQIDWKQQAGCMAGIYERAYITLAATSAADSGEGFLTTRETSRELFGVHKCGVPFSVYVRRRVGHAALFHGVHAKFHPLFSRGWCFQERLLSRRVLHFTRNEIIFECGEGMRCECSRILQHGYGNRLKALYSRTVKKKVVAEVEDADVRTISSTFTLGIRISNRIPASDAAIPRELQFTLLGTPCL